MPLTEQDSLQIICGCLEILNQKRAADSHPLIPLVPETRLLSAEGELDSLEFVNLVVALEEHLAERLQRPIVLANDDAFSEARFRDVATRAAYLSVISKQ